MDVGIDATSGNRVYFSAHFYFRLIATGSKGLSEVYIYCRLQTYITLNVDVDGVRTLHFGLLRTTEKNAEEGMGEDNIKARNGVIAMDEETVFVSPKHVVGSVRHDGGVIFKGS